MGSYTQTNGGSTPVSTGGKGTSMSLPPAWAHNAPRAGFGDDYGNSPRPTSPTYDPTGGGPAATSLPQGYQPLPSQGGKGSSQTVGGMSPPPDVAARYGGSQQQILTALRSLFQPRQQQPSYQYQAPTYAQMQQQALPQGWQSPQAPPTPPPAAPAPAADTERRMAEMQARINQLTEQRSQVYDPIAMGLSGHTVATGGRIKRKTGGKVKSNIVERALAATRRK